MVAYFTLKFLDKKDEYIYDVARARIHWRCVIQFYTKSTQSSRGVVQSEGPFKERDLCMSRLFVGKNYTKL